MKKILTLICLAAAAFAAPAAERSDTLATLVRPDSVRVAVTPSSLSVTASGRSHGEPYTYEYTTETDAGEVNGQWDIDFRLPCMPWNTCGRHCPKNSVWMWNTIKKETFVSERQQSTKKSYRD